MSVRDVAVRAYSEALPVLLVSATGGLFAGLVLGGMDVELRDVDGLLLLVPALLATRGNVYGSLGARLASALHQGLVEPRLGFGDERVRVAVVTALTNGLLVSAFAAVAGFALLFALGRPRASLHVLVAIAVVGGLLSGILLAVTVVAVVFLGYRRGLNPDTLAGPVVTTTGDVVGITMLLLAVRLVVWLVPGGV